MPADGASAVFYDHVVSDQRGLPCSEGVVAKDNNDLTGAAAWYKVTQSDLADFELVQVLPGKSGKFATSAGAIEVMQKTPAGAPRAGPVVDFDPDKNQSNEAISALRMAGPESPGGKVVGSGVLHAAMDAWVLEGSEISVRSTASSSMPTASATRTRAG